MDTAEITQKIGAIIEEAKTAVLTTVDEHGRPHARWMTPTLLRGRPGALFAVTSPLFVKVLQLGAHPEVEWLLQTPALTEIVSITGRVNILDNPALKCEVTDAIGRRLTVFWRVNVETTDFVVLETVIEEATYFRPMKGMRETVRF